MLCYYICQLKMIYSNGMSAHALTRPKLPNRKHGRNHQLVLEVLIDASKPMGAYDLLDILREQGLRSPLQIYPALEQLIRDGAVHRIESLNAYALSPTGSVVITVLPCSPLAQNAVRPANCTTRRWSACCIVLQVMEGSAP